MALKEAIILFYCISCNRICKKSHIQANPLESAALSATECPLAAVFQPFCCTFCNRMPARCGFPAILLHFLQQNARSLRFSSHSIAPSATECPLAAAFQPFYCTFCNRTPARCGFPAILLHFLQQNARSLRFSSHSAALSATECPLAAAFQPFYCTFCNRTPARCGFPAILLHFLQQNARSYCPHPPTAAPAAAPR